MSLHFGNNRDFHHGASLFSATRRADIKRAHSMCHKEVIVRIPKVGPHINIKRITSENISPSEYVTRTVQKKGIHKQWVSNILVMNFNAMQLYRNTLVYIFISSNTIYLMAEYLDGLWSWNLANFSQNTNQFFKSLVLTIMSEISVDLVISIQYNTIPAIYIIIQIQVVLSYFSICKSTQFTFCYIGFNIKFIRVFE